MSTDLFWGENPNALFNPTLLFELFPMSTMTHNQQLNAISRLVILLSLLFYFALQSVRVIFMSIFTLGAIWLIHYTTERKKKVRFSEHFETSDVATEYISDKSIPSDIFGKPTLQNPFQNVLITDYQDAANKKAAPPAYIPMVQEQIIQETKKLINSINSQQPNMSDNIFRSLEDNLAFEQSMRPFYSTPATTIPNDQGAFADFCFGSMTSCKEGNSFACAKQLSSSTY